MSVSFDGATKDTYEAIRRGARYEKVTTNIKKFNEYRNLLPIVRRPTMDMTYVLMRRNIEELPVFAGLAKELGADSISAAHVVIFDPAMEGESLIYHKELANKYLIEAKKKAAEVGIKVLSFPPLFDICKNTETTPKEQTHLKKYVAKVKRWLVSCPFLWQKAHIGFGGDATPCCVGGCPVMGNIVDRSFKEIWNGEVYQKMRRRLNSENPFECCKHCNQREETVVRADEEAFIQS